MRVIAKRVSLLREVTEYMSARSTRDGRDSLVRKPDRRYVIFAVANECALMMTWRTGSAILVTRDIVLNQALGASLQHGKGV